MTEVHVEDPAPTREVLRARDRVWLQVGLLRVRVRVRARVRVRLRVRVGVGIGVRARVGVRVSPSAARRACTTSAWPSVA